MDNFKFPNITQNISGINPPINQGFCYHPLPDKTDKGYLYLGVLGLNVILARLGDIV